MSQTHVPESSWITLERTAGNRRDPTDFPAKRRRSKLKGRPYATDASKVGGAIYRAVAAYCRSAKRARAICRVEAEKDVAVHPPPDDAGGMS
jgi:hypothetical protein